MYKNVGRKIKGLSIFIAWAIVAACCLYGFYFLFSSKMEVRDIIITALIVVIGSLAGVFVSWFLYAFGVVAEKSEAANENLENLLLAIDEISSKLETKEIKHVSPIDEPVPNVPSKEIPLESFKLPETRDELFASQLKKLKKDYEMSRITYDEYEAGKKRLEQKYK